MKATQIIAQIQDIVNTEGDFEVCSWPYDGHGHLFPAFVHTLTLPSGEQVIMVDGDEPIEVSEPPRS